jgi:sugar lactone lactonase YvrE
VLRFAAQIVIAVALIAGAAQSAFAEKRVALVIGNNAYANLPARAQLRRAVNDARSVSQAFSDLGFEVSKIENASRAGFNAQWQQFLGGIEEGSTVAFYFSGHGVEIEGQNFLLPSDIPLVEYGRQEHLKRESISVSDLLLDLRKRKPGVSLLILDACREHPLVPEEFKAIDVVPSGLAKMDAPIGTFIMYSAWAGQLALDRLPAPMADPDPLNSIFTRKLLPLMRQKGLQLRDLAAEVRQQVHHLAATVPHPQTPAYYDGLLGKFCLAGCDATATPAPQGHPYLANGYENKAQRLVRTFADHGASVSIAFSPDGSRALSGNWENFAVKLWDVATGRELRAFKGHRGSVKSVAFSPDGSKILSGGADETLKLWDVAAGREIRAFMGHTFHVNSVAFSPDGSKALSGSSDKTLKLWDVATGREIRAFTGHTGHVNSVAFSPDGSKALSGSSDKTLKLWDVATGREIRALTGHTGDVNSVAFSPDGSKALSGSDDKTLKLWDVATGREIRASAHTSSVHSVAFSPDGRYIASCSGFQADPFFPYLALTEGEITLRA